MDDAHAAALAGAPAGTLIVADVQRQGRGRAGRRWSSASNSGLWMTLVERPEDSEMLGVLALRIGMALANALDPFVSHPIRLKWPNDLFVGDGKLAGVLIEARWRESLVDWVAIGVGVNMRAPSEFSPAASVRDDVSRSELLQATIPPIREAARRTGALNEPELDEWRLRDLSAGRRITSPTHGVVQGISTDGALMVESDGVVSAVRAGSLVFSS